MIAFILSHGYDYETTSVLSAWTTFDAAVVAARKHTELKEWFPRGDINKGEAHFIYVANYEFYRIDRVKVQQ